MCFSFHIFQIQYLVRYTGYIEEEWIDKTSLECDVLIEEYEMEQMAEMRSENEAIRLQVEAMNEAINKNSVEIENVTQQFRSYAKKMDLVLAAFKERQEDQEMNTPLAYLNIEKKTKQSHKFICRKKANGGKCGKMFTRKYNLQRHYRRVHKKKQK